MKDGQFVEAIKLWHFGPDFLYKSTCHWPEDRSPGQHLLGLIHEPDCEVIPATKDSDVACVYVTSIQEDPTESWKKRWRQVLRARPVNIDKIIKIEDFNEINRLLRVTAFVIRFIENLKRRGGTNAINLDIYLSKK